MSFYFQSIVFFIIILLGYFLLRHLGYIETIRPSKRNSTSELLVSEAINNGPSIEFGKAVTMAESIHDQKEKVFTTVPNNEVVLMSTLEPFPWKQIPKDINEITIKLEAFIGPQNSSNFLVVSSGDGLFTVLSKDNDLVFKFGNVTVSLTETGFSSPVLPIGTLTLSAKIQFHSQDKQLMIIKAQAQVGDIQLKSNPNIITKKGWGSNIRNKFKSANDQMFQGVNINSLQTTVKWKTFEKTT